MSVISGGIFSKPRGKTGGIVFGAARTRQGKLATARELVKPSNPNTAAQQTQRNKFRSALDLVRKIGSDIYRNAWNRSVGQLPGFQSMVSIFLNQMSDSMDIVLTFAVNLGLLHFPDSVIVSAVGGGEVEFTYSGELGSNGTADDLFSIIAVAKTDANRQLPYGVITEVDRKRSQGGTSLTDFIVGETYEIYVYMTGANTASGLYSVAKHYSVLIT